MEQLEGEETERQSFSKLWPLTLTPNLSCNQTPIFVMLINRWKLRNSVIHEKVIVWVFSAHSGGHWWCNWIYSDGQWRNILQAWETYSDKHISITYHTISTFCLLVVKNHFTETLHIINQALCTWHSYTISFNFYSVWSFYQSKMNHHILWHAHFKSNSIHLPTIASIIYTKPPLSSWVLRKAWSMRKCSCKVASIAARLYCIQWLQTEIAHICISCMLPNKSREYFAFCMVLSVTQVKSAQSWEKTHFKPRATHTQLHLLHFILLCVCVCARAHLCDLEMS